MSHRMTLWRGDASESEAWRYESFAHQLCQLVIMCVVQCYVIGLHVSDGCRTSELHHGVADGTRSKLGELRSRKVKGLGLI